MPCCNNCKGSLLSWSGPTALASTRKCLMPLLKLKTPSGRVAPRHTAKCQTLFWGLHTSGKGINPCHGDNEVLAQFTAALAEPSQPLPWVPQGSEQDHEKAGPKV